jgi:NADH:ubiquinone oxidoreductase subunit E
MMKIKVCVGSNCTLLGAMNILDSIEDLKDIISENPENYSDEALDVEAVKCIGFCKESEKEVAPVVIIDEVILTKATSQVVMEKILDRIKI